MTPDQYPLDKLLYDTYGSGTPHVLLLSGWGHGRQGLVSIAKPLSLHRTVWMVALPGFDGSPDPETDWGTLDYSRLVQRWIESQGIAPVDIIAHSFGGRVTIGLSALYPGSVGRLVLIASAGIVPPRSFKTSAKIALAKGLRVVGHAVGGEFEKRIQEKRRRLGSTDWRNSSHVMRGVMRKILNEDLAEYLPQIHAPVRLIWGSDDTATPVILARRMTALLPDSRLTLFDGVGHFPFTEKTGETLAAVWEHLGIKQAW